MRRIKFRDLFAIWVTLYRVTEETPIPPKFAHLRSAELALIKAESAITARFLSSLAHTQIAKFKTLIRDFLRVRNALVRDTNASEAAFPESRVNMVCRKLAVAVGFQHKSDDEDNDVSEYNLPIMAENLVAYQKILDAATRLESFSYLDAVIEEAPEVVECRLSPTRFLFVIGMVKDPRGIMRKYSAHATAIDQLIEKSIELNVPAVVSFWVSHHGAYQLDSSGYLHRLMALGWYDIMAQMIAQGADPKVKNGSGQSLLQSALLTSEEDRVAQVILVGADLSETYTKQRKSVAHIAAERGWINVIEALGTREIQVDQRDGDHLTPLMFAAAHGHGHVVATLVKMGADKNAVSKKGDSALMFAASGPHDVIFQYLMELPDILVDTENTEGKTALYFAVAHGIQDISKLLLRTRVDVLKTYDKEAQNLLHLAARTGIVKTVRLLLDRGLTKNSLTADHMTPLHFAAESGNIELAKLLITPENLNAKSVELGYTPLHMAVFKRQLGMIRYLLAQTGIDVEVRDKINNTALRYAQIVGNQEIMGLFSEAKANQTQATQQVGKTLKNMV